MTILRAVVLVMVLGCACAPPPPSPHRTTPSAAASAVAPTPVQGLAVLVNFPNGAGPASTGYDLSLVAVDGHTVAHAHAGARSYIHAGAQISAPAAPDLPEVSVANGKVYYLDGDQQVRYLAPDGSSGKVTMVPGSATAHAAFAFSPDGSRMAVSVLAYQAGSASMTLYVEDIASGARVVLLQSSTEYAWPVAWHSGDLVLAEGPLFSQQGLWDNPYFAANFHVVDATTANRKATIGGPDYISSCEVSGLLAPTGVACYHRTASAGMGGVFLLLGWDGIGMVSPAVESANGGTASIDPGHAQTFGLLDASRPALVVLGPDSEVAVDLSGPVDSWPCWLDENHALIGSVSQYRPVVVDLASKKLQPVDARGFCAAVLGGFGEVR